MLGNKIIGKEASEMETQKTDNTPKCKGKGIQLQQNLKDMTDKEIEESLTAKMKEVAEKSVNLDGGDKYKVSPKEWIPVIAVTGLFLLGIALALNMSAEK